MLLADKAALADQHFHLRPNVLPHPQVRLCIGQRPVSHSSPWGGIHPPPQEPRGHTRYRQCHHRCRHQPTLAQSETARPTPGNAGRAGVHMVAYAGLLTCIIAPPTQPALGSRVPESDPPAPGLDLAGQQQRLLQRHAGCRRHLSALQHVPRIHWRQQERPVCRSKALIGHPPHRLRVRLPRHVHPCPVVRHR